jgi:CRISPR-associated endonuclease/helicase Cas3
MDVAAVFLRMLQLPVIRDRLNTSAGTALSPLTCQRLAALVFLHDIAKLHPGFQARGWPPGLWGGPFLGHVEQGCAFLILAGRWRDHPFHSAVRQVIEWGDAVESLLDAVLAHHGRPVASPPDPSPSSWKEVSHYNWRDEARMMADALHRWFGVAFGPEVAPLPDEPRLYHFVAGLAALADWIGSDRQFFPFSAPFEFSYDAKADSQATRALSAIGFAPGSLHGRPAASFLHLTGYPPRSAQAAVGAVPPDAQLLVLEAETGSGKTEAALWRYAQLVAAGAVSGLYFAVPTSEHARIDLPIDMLSALRVLAAQHDGYRRVPQILVPDHFSDALIGKGIIDVLGIDGPVNEYLVLASHLNEGVLVILVVVVMVADEHLVHNVLLSTILSAPVPADAIDAPPAEPA